MRATHEVSHSKELAGNPVKFRKLQCGLERMLAKTKPVMHEEVILNPEHSMLKPEMGQQGSEREDRAANRARHLCKRVLCCSLLDFSAPLPACTSSQYGLSLLRSRSSWSRVPGFLGSFSPAAKPLRQQSRFRTLGSQPLLQAAYRTILPVPASHILAFLLKLQNLEKVTVASESSCRGPGIIISHMLAKVQ